MDQGATRCDTIHSYRLFMGSKGAGGTQCSSGVRDGIRKTMAAFF